MSFYDKIDTFIGNFPPCEIIIYDETVLEPEFCPNKAVGYCPLCNKKICNYHINLHSCDRFYRND